MQSRESTRRRWGRVLLLVLAVVAAAPGLAATDAQPEPATVAFWNRNIVTLRSTVAGAPPQARAEHAVERLNELPLNVTTDDILRLPLTVDQQAGVAFTHEGRVLFFLSTNDLDKESGETLGQATRNAVAALGEALQARVAERSWPVIRSGLLFTFAGLVLLIFVGSIIYRSHARVQAFLRSKEPLMPLRVRLFGVDFRPHLVAAVFGLARGIAWLLALSAIYAWLALSLRRFPYTQPWGKQLGQYVLQLFQQLASAAVHALPGIFAVIVIFLITRWVVRLASGFFGQVASGRTWISWMDPDIARATQRIFAAIAWIFAVVVAYPYIPGSSTEAFKGVSVFFGLVISLGSTGIINQIMSGLFVVYSRALKTGEWVKVNDIEGEVLEVGLLAAKIRTIEGQEVTIPNSVLVGTSTVNYSRLGHPDGMIASSTVTIGYDAPWRQVHSLLLLAAGRTGNIRKQPAPYVLQRQLSDFYVEYTVICRLVDEKVRIETLSELHSRIQDAFNEFGVQIMSPHYMVQPAENMVVPPSKWYPAPAGKPGTPNPQSTKAGE